MSLKEVAKRIKIQAMLQLQTGSDDAYGQGLYNGLLMAATIFSNQRYRPLSLSAFRHAQKRSRETDAARKR